MRIRIGLFLPSVPPSVRKDVIRWGVRKGRGAGQVTPMVRVFTTPQAIREVEAKFGDLDFEASLLVFTPREHKGACSCHATWETVVVGRPADSDDVFAMT